MTFESDLELTDAVDAGCRPDADAARVRAPSYPRCARDGVAGRPRWSAPVGYR